MTVFENIAFGLRVRPRKAAPVRSRRSGRGSANCWSWCSSMGSANATLPSSPEASVSGSRWRVRWRSNRKVLLLDEPFGALDAKVRKELRRWLRRLHDELHITSVFVTHDQEEALEVANRVVVMNHGRIEQAAHPRRSTTIRRRRSSTTSWATSTCSTAACATARSIFATPTSRSTRATTSPAPTASQRRSI